MIMKTSVHSMKVHRFRSREDAGCKLAKRLTKFVGISNVIVLAMPKGSVPVAAEVARVLTKQFDVLLVGKITVPGGDHPPLGAITGGGVRILNYELIDRLHLSDSEVSTAVMKESLDLARRERFYRGHHASLDVADHTVILVDDGTTPCTTVCDAIRLLRRQNADRIVVALPAACRHAAWNLRLEADEVVTLAEPATSIPSGKWFKHFPRTTAAGVRRLLSLDSLGTMTS
jgi:putative phosphoribosyl transferase